MLTKIVRKLPEPFYYTEKGFAYVGDALDLLKKIPPGTINLVLTSPPFPLQREKEYGNPAEENEFNDWFVLFARQVYRILKDDGSFVVDLGSVYVKNRPVKSLYNYILLIKLVDEVHFTFPQDFFWFNPSKLPSPIEWVNKRKIRVKDAVNTIWWLAKGEYPKTNLSQILLPYSDRMKQLLKLQERFYRPKKRPSGHEISKVFMDVSEDKGAIPPNLLVIPNTDSNSKFIQYCKKLGARLNPSRFPESLPEFFINFLTSPGDIVIDIFAGSNSTGYVAENLSRWWLAFEIESDYVLASALRFAKSEEHARSIFEKAMAGQVRIRI